MYFVLASVVYFLYGLQNSKLNNNNKALEFEFTTISNTDNDDDEELTNPINNDYDNKNFNPIINTKRFWLV